MHYKFSFAVVFLILLCCSCQKNFVTGRRTLELVPEKELDKICAEQYKDILRTNTVLDSTDPAALRVRRVGNNVRQAVESIYLSIGHPEQLEGYTWEFNVVKDTILNAFCMPGGKVIVYSELLHVVQNDSMLAFVMAHEIAHAVARHGNARASEAILTQFGKKTISVSMILAPRIVKDIVLASFGATTTLGLLQFSRNDEKEADRMGLIFMAKAGYNPYASLTMMSELAKLVTVKPFVLFSTHPADKHRLALLKKRIPKALKYYSDPN